MKKYVAIAGLLAMLVQPVAAWRPTGWVHMNYPWAYDSATGHWMWFNPNTQWVRNMTAGSWSLLPDSGLATGWAFYQWPFAYTQDNSAWNWINPNVQWVRNMNTATWSRFGEPVAPAGMVWIPGGRNEGVNPLGTGESHSEWYPATYSLVVSSFYMDKYKVTQALWNDVHAWATHQGYTFDNAGSGKAANHPVHTVNWYDVVKWCNARSQRQGLLPAYYTDEAFTDLYITGRVDHVHIHPGANGYRLPTAEQWEYAARGGASSRRFPWGDSDDIGHDRANYLSEGTSSYDTSSTTGYHPAHTPGGMPYTNPVDAFPANAYGLHDMAGNLHEWCFDWLADHEGTSRWVRGGFWGSYANACRTGHVNASPPGYTSYDRGFRTVRP